MVAVPSIVVVLTEPFTLTPGDISKEIRDVSTDIRQEPIPDPYHTLDKFGTVRDVMRVYGAAISMETAAPPFPS